MYLELDNSHFQNQTLEPRRALVIERNLKIDILWVSHESKIILYVPLKAKWFYLLCMHSKLR